MIKHLILLLAAFCCNGVASSQIPSGEKDNDKVSCTVADISFFRSLHCPDGSIGESSSNCVCGNNNGCELLGLRRYLPRRDVFDEIYYNKHVLMCDRLFKMAFSAHLMKNKNMTKHSGYPQDCRVPNECHTPSLGKFIRYNSLMQFHAYRGLANDTLFDFQYPWGFRWARDIRSCDVDGATRNSWECAFSPFSKSLEQDLANRDKRLLHPDKREAPISEATATLLDSLMPYVDEMRRQRRNNMAQLLLYGRILYTISQPSNLVQKYISEHTITLNPHVVLSYSKEKFNGSASTSALAPVESGGRRPIGNPLHKAPPTISMHVRQGDSCDKVLDHMVEDMTHYITKNSSNGEVVRPCFSIDVYMIALRALREKYGSLQVYLSTDSQEMMHRAQLEVDFTWVLINSSRSAYANPNNLRGNMKYVDFFESSSNEAVLFGGLADLNLLARGDIFLGAFTSHFSKIAYYAMVGHHMRVLPFHSLDYPLSCDTTDTCTKEDLAHRNLTIEQMVQWVPECLHGVLDWSPSSDRDPCGIYL